MINAHHRTKAVINHEWVALLSYNRYGLMIFLHRRDINKSLRDNAKYSC